MAAGNGMNMAVGLDLSQLQKDLKTLDKNLNSVVGQEKVIKIKAILEDEGKAMKGFESLHKAITELSDARANLKIDGNLVNDMSIKEAQKSLRQFRKELKDINSGKIADPSGQRATQLMANITNVGRWVNATKASAKELANIGWVDVNRQAAKAKAARAAIDKEMKRLRAEMDKLGAVSPADLKARESYLKRLITLQEQYNKTYARTPKKGASQLADLQHELQMTRSIGENNKLLNSQVKIFDRLKTFAARYVSIYTLAHFGRKIVEITGYFDQQRVALEGIVGSAEKANELLNQIKAFALQSPKTTKELIGYTKQLAAYSIPYEELFATTRRLADLSTGLGVDMQRLILAYGQVKAAAVLRGQELRQFTEAGIPMVSELAKKFTQLNGTLVTTGEVFELISKRQVSFEMVKSVMEDMTNEGGKFYKMQENIVETLYGQVQKLGDVWTLSINKLGQSSGGVLMNVVHLLQKLAENIKPIFTGLIAGALVRILGKAPKWIAGVNASFAQTKAQVADLNRRIVFLNAHMQRLKANGMAFTKSMQMANAQMRSLKMQRAAVGANIAFGILAVTVGAVVTAIKAARQRTEEFNNTIHEIESASAKETQKLKDGLDGLISKLRVFNEGTKEYNKAIDTLKSNYGDYINEDLIEALIHERDAIGDTVQSWNSLHDAIIASIEAKKEYDRHVSLSEAKGTAASQSLTTNSAWYNVFSGDSVGREFIKWLRSNQPDDDGRYHGNPWVNISKTGSREEYAVNEAVKAFFERGISYEYDTNGNLKGDPFEDFKKRLKESADLYADGSQDVIMAFAGRMYDIISSNDYFKQFNDEQRYLASNPRNIAERRWSKAERDASDAYEGRWEGNANSRKVVSQASTDYDPRTWKKNAQLAYKDALKDIVSAWSVDVNEMYSSASANDKKGIISDVSRYNELIRRYREQIANFDADNVEQSTVIASSLTDIIGVIANPDLRARLSEARQRYIELAGTITGVSKTIAQNIGDNYGSGAAITVEQKDFFERYSPTEETVEANRNALREMYQKNKATIESHRNDSVWRDVVARLQQQNEWIEILAGKQYYDIVDLEKKSGSGIEREFPEFVNIFKDAYELYKRATSEGGIEAGVAKVKTDDAILDLFGDFFGTEGKISAFNMNIGNKSISDIVKAARIEGGQEDQIVDFKKAAKDTAEAMIRYGEADPDRRGHFIREGQRLLKWVADTFADDSVTKWLNELSKATENLTVSFENMHNNIELGRKMTEMGTVESYSTVAGVDLPNLTKPRSVEQRENIGSIISMYNDWAGRARNENGEPIAQQFSLTKSIDDMNLSDIADELKKLTDESDMNMQAFRATKEGNIMMSRLTAALKELDKTVREETAKVSGKAASGNRLSDTIHNAGINAKNAQMMNAVIQEIARSLGLSADQVAASNRVDTAKSSADDILKAFLDSNNYETMFSAFRKPIDFSKIEEQLNKLIADLPEIERKEVEKRYNVMKGDADVFNASRGDFAPFFAGLDNYRTAEQRAQAVWSGYATDSKATALGSKFDEEANAWSLEGITDPEALAYLNELNRSLDEVGKNGIKLSAIFKKQALDSVKNFATTAQNTLDAMSGVVKNLVSSVQSFVKAFNKAYDVMNDGENPKWMQDTEAFLGDFAENFEAMIAPMSAVIALIIAITVAITVCEAVATPLLIVMAAVVAAAAILAAIMAAFQQHDRNLEHSIEGLKEDVEAFDNAITNLQAAAERSVGFEKLRKNIAATGKELEKATAYAEMARLEKDKKNTDDDKVKEYEQSAQESLDAFLNNLRDVRDELATATEEWADQMGGAIRSAFQNGENAARAFRNTVKTMIGDVIENMLEMAILQPLIESALENWTNSDYLRQKYTKEWTEKDENGNTIKRKSFDQDNYLKELLDNIGDPDKAENFYQSMLMIGDTLIDTVNGMPSVLQDFYKYNSELGTLSGGIESVTEDTARRIEALENSKLGEVFAIRTMLQNYLEGSGFGDSMTADLQAAIVSIASDTNLIRITTESILSRIDQMRTSNVQPLHVTIV